MPSRYRAGAPAATDYPGSHAGLVRYPGSMSTDSQAPEARKASLVPDKPTLDGIEDRWSRWWENSGVVQV
jgi:hypothetical protein